MVADAVVSRLGLSKRLEEILKASGFRVGEVDEIRGEPSLEATVRRLASAVGIPRAWRDVGISFGGGMPYALPRPNNPRPLDGEALLRLHEVGWRGEPFREVN